MDKRIIYLPFVFLSMTIFFPYLLGVPNENFPIKLFLQPYFHILIAFVLISILILCCYLASVNTRDFEKSNVVVLNRSQNLILFSMLYISIGTNFYLLIVGFDAYVEGGFDLARSETYFTGIGLPLRLYLISLPLLSISYLRTKLFSSICIVLVFLTLARVVTQSERMALLELFSVFYCVVVLNNIKLSYIGILKFVVPMIVVFYIVLQIRLQYIGLLNSSFEDEGIFNLTMLYYADALNKFYLALFNDFTFSSKSIYSEISDYMGFANNPDLYIDDEFIIDALNNPGGLAQDVNMFSVYGFLFIFLIKFYSIAWVFSRFRYHVFLISIYPLLVIEVFEYVRFDYLISPFVFLLIVAAIFTSILLFLTKTKNIQNHENCC